MIDFLIDHARLGSLLLFSGFFTAMLIWLIWPGKTDLFNRQARSILETGDE